jgi:hypothetical protein
MEPSREGRNKADRPGSPARTLVWIDTRVARIVRWDGHSASIEQLESEVPDHRKATGMVRRQPRYDAGLMSGGYGHPRTSDDDHRLEHLARFLDSVATRTSDDNPVDIVGPGTVREHLERVVREGDARHHRTRPVSCSAAPRLTDRQLVARVRGLAGDPPRRRTLGAYRWTGPAGTEPSGAPARGPRRVVEKPPDVRSAIEAAMMDAEIDAASAEARSKPEP